MISNIFFYDIRELCLQFIIHWKLWHKIAVSPLYTCTIRSQIHYHNYTTPEICQICVQYQRRQDILQLRDKTTLLRARSNLCMWFGNSCRRLGGMWIGTDMDLWGVGRMIGNGMNKLSHIYGLLWDEPINALISIADFIKRPLKLRHG